jgi:hypothetical protein
VLLALYNFVTKSKYPDSPREFVINISNIYFSAKNNKNPEHLIPNVWTLLEEIYGTF